MLRSAKLLFVLALTAGLLVLSPQTSWACSCRTGSTAEHLDRARTVVDGRLDWVATNGITTTYSVVVAKVYKGKAAEREKLVSSASEASCGLGPLATDKRYLFFIDGEHPGQMKVGLCGGTTPYDAALAAKISAITGEPPTGPYATPGSRPGPVDDTPIDGTPWYTVVITGLVLAGALGWLIWIRKKA